MPIIDTHCHVYPDAIAERASQGIGEFYNYPVEANGRIDTLLDLGASVGITHHMICSVATAPRQVASINRFLHDSAAAHPDRLIALGALHPDSEDQEADVELVLSLGAAGIKLHPDIHGVAVDDPRYFKIFELCEGRLPVLCHLGDERYDFSNPNRVKRVLQNFPKLTLIGAHFGGWSVWKEATEQLAGFDNLLVDSSSSLFALSPAEGTALVHAYGAERVLFGVDYPLWSPVGEMQRFSALDLTASERENILWKNAARLYNIKNI